MSQSSNTFTCPRCGERLPAGFTRCDACGAYIVPSSGGHQGGQQSGQQGGGAKPRQPARHAPQSSAGLPPWAFLVIGLLAGGVVGYALRTAVTPRMEGGAPRGPADVMAGGGMGGGDMGGGDMGGGPMGGGAMGGGDMGGGPMGGGAMGAPGGMQQSQMLPQVIEALAKYRNVLAEDPTNVEANTGMGNMMFDSGKWDKAVEYYTTALTKDPKNADVRVDRAICYHSLGQEAQALADLKQVTREQPTHKNAWLNLGVVAGAMGDNKTNIAAWEQYLKLDPSGQHSDAIKSELAKLK